MSVPEQQLSGYQRRSTRSALQYQPDVQSSRSIKRPCSTAVVVDSPDLRDQLRYWCAIAVRRRFYPSNTLSLSEQPRSSNVGGCRRLTYRYCTTDLTDQIGLLHKRLSASESMTEGQIFISATIPPHAPLGPRYYKFRLKAGVGNVQLMYTSHHVYLCFIDACFTATFCKVCVCHILLKNYLLTYLIIHLPIAMRVCH